jgi:hypothetical protein
MLERFSATTDARFAHTLGQRVSAIILALALLAAAGLHRLWGYAQPHHAWLRLLEVQYLGHWAPAGIEHVITACAACVLFALWWSVMPTTRNRMLLGLVFAVLYLVTSTWLYDGRQFMASGDTDQLVQMVCDVAGLLLALLWLSWPQRREVLQVPNGLSV